MADASSEPEPKHLEVPGLAYAYGTVLVMIIVPQFVLIHPYLHLLIMAPLLVWIGCQRSLLQTLKSPEDSQARNPETCNESFAPPDTKSRAEV